MDKALISLSFDDGRADNISVFEELLWPNHIPVTLGVATGYVDGSCPPDNRPTERPAMKVDDVIRYGKKEDSLIEIALHGDRHLDTVEDISAGRKKLIEWLHLPQNTIFGLANPGSGVTRERFNDPSNLLFREQISYMRTSFRIKSLEKQRIFYRKLGRVWHRPLFYRLAYHDTLMERCPDRIIYAVPVMKDITLQQVQGLVNLAVYKKAALTLMFHSIDRVRRGDDNWVWDIEKFKGLVEYILMLIEERQPLKMSTTRELYETIRVKKKNTVFNYKK